jgi:acetyl esterase/lipase
VELTLAGEALLSRARQILHDVDDAVSATRSIGGELAARVARLWEPMADLRTGGIDVQTLRADYEALHAQYEPPADVAIGPIHAGGVPGLLLTPPQAAGRLLYLHGGGYLAGSAFGYRHLAGALAAAAGAATVLPDYRLAPEHPLPAALEDALRCYLWLLDQGTSPQEITLAGDSSGGGLVLSALVGLTQQELPLPGCAILLSPWIDLTATRPSPPPDQTPPAGQEPALAADLYLAGHPTDDPLISPLTADLTGLPPILIQAAAGDPQSSHARQLARHARGHGVDVRLELYSADVHTFHIFWSFLPEAADAIHQAGRFAAAPPSEQTGLPRVPARRNPVQPTRP